MLMQVFCRRLGTAIAEGLPVLVVELGTGSWELGAGSWELGRRVRSLATSRNVEHPTAALTRANSWIGWKRALNLSGTQL